MTLSSLGWSDAWAHAFQPYSAAGLLPARVALQHKHACDLLTDSGALTGFCTGRLLHTAASPAELPVVGDWVAIRPRPGEAQADIHAVLPRRSRFSRRAAGDTPVEQVIAANLDVLLLVAGLDRDFNLRRIERYLAAAADSGAQPVVVLNKADLHPAPDAARHAAAACAGSAPVIVLSAQEGSGLDALAPWLQPGLTLALLGSSGVGKSTLVNRLLGQETQRTATVSAAVGKGRHTTTRRELHVLPAGGVLIDTPGLRELQLWDPPAAAWPTAFEDVQALAAGCRFRDCSHQREPGCAIQAALDAGALPLERWLSYQKLQREQAHAARKADAQLSREQRQTWKKINRAQRQRRHFEESS